MNWQTHFQVVSRTDVTAAFGGYMYNPQFEGDSFAGLNVSDEAKKIGVPVAAGVALALVAKMSGILGPGPLLLGALGGLGTALALHLSALKVPDATDAPTAPAPSPQAAPVWRSAPAPFIDPVQRAPAPVTAAVPSKPWRVVASLSRDNAILSVADVQNALNELGFAQPYLVVDGKAGNATANAVKKAQAKYGLPQTGSTSQADLKIRLSSGMADKVSNAKASAAADALVADMKSKGLV
jgi:hypothetical protein